MRTISAIAKEAQSDWVNIYFGAVPYLDAMRELETVRDKYFADTGDSIVRYFLSNATTWRGETARRIKKELTAILKE